MTDDVVAIHESGHALMATVLGFELLRVQVDNDDPRYDLAPGPSRRLDRVRVLMAGGGAERVIFDREPIGTGSDDQQIADLLGLDDDETALRDEVRRFLRLNAGTLRYIAAQLARRGVLYRRRGCGAGARANLTARTSLTNGGDLADHVCTWQKRTRGPPSRWSADPDLP